MNKLELRALEISYKHKLSHLSSVLTSINIIDKIYELKKSDEPFILSNGHAALALFVVLEKYGYGDAEKLCLKHGTHPNRDMEHGIWATTGSLGHGIGIAVGMALSNKNRNVYVLMSDGECAEGSVYESLAAASYYKLENLRISVVCNGTAANRKVDVDLIDYRLNFFYPTMCIRSNLFQLPEWVQGVNGHYVVMDEAKYKEILT